MAASSMCYFCFDILEHQIQQNFNTLSTTTTSQKINNEAATSSQNSNSKQETTMNTEQQLFKKESGFGLKGVWWITNNKSKQQEPLVEGKTKLSEQTIVPFLQEFVDTTAQDISELLSQKKLNSGFKTAQQVEQALTKIEGLACDVSMIKEDTWRPLDHWEDWDLQKDDLILSLIPSPNPAQDGSKFLREVESGRALPHPDYAQYACANVKITQTGWDKKKTLEYLIRKAGYGGSLSNANFEQVMEERVQLFAFQRSRRVVKYVEFSQWRHRKLTKMINAKYAQKKAQEAEAMANKQKMRKRIKVKRSDLEVAHSHEKVLSALGKKSAKDENKSSTIASLVLIATLVAVIGGFLALRFYESTYDIDVDEFYDNYKLLGLPVTATKSQVKKAFRELSRVYHPDKVKNCDEECEQRFMKLTQAHKQILDYEAGRLNLIPKKKEE